jgi:hypothetical protein
MAQEVELKIDDEKFEVRRVSYEIFHLTTPRTVSRFDSCGLKIKISRESDDNVGIARSTFDSSQINRKASEITFRIEPEEGTEGSQVAERFRDHYEEHVPSTSAMPNEQMYEYFEISAELVDVNGVEYKKDWKGK